MKVLLLLLLLLLLSPTLSSSGLQDVVKKSSRHENVSLLNSTLEDEAPDTSTQRSTLTHQRLSSLATIKQKRQAPPPSSMFDNNGQLKWQRWTGSLLNNTVSIFNQYTRRIEYVCKCNCSAGFYNPNMGHFCHYPYGDKEYRVSSFDILVNENNFEILEWKDGSYGSVPQHSVWTCPNKEVFVGKNKYGLGKVHRKHEALFLPWKGKEYWYKYYKVLTINADIESEEIFNVKYNTDQAVIQLYPPETISTSTVTNNECSPVTKTSHLSQTYRVESRWDITSSVTVGVKKTFSAGVPGGVSGSVEVSGEITFQASGGNTKTDETTRSTSLEVIVKPNHYCKVRMVAYKSKVDVPFTARLRRTYRTGENTLTTVYGNFNSVQVGDIQTVADRCQPVVNATSCSHI